MRDAGQAKDLDRAHDAVAIMRLQPPRRRRIHPAQLIVKVFNSLARGGFEQFVADRG